MTRHINEEGLKLIKQWEGLRTEAYCDVAGIWTIGYGHTSAAGGLKVEAGLKISEAQAEKQLQKDLYKFEKRVETLVKVRLTDNQHAVLVSFDFNTGALHKSTLLKKLNAGNYNAVPGELMKWVNAGGKKIQGLVNRRAAECGLWAKGEFVSSNYVVASPQVRAVSAEKEAQAASVAGAGVLGTMVLDTASQLEPHASTMPFLRWLFVALTLAGIGIGIYATIRRVYSGNM